VGEAGSEIVSGMSQRETGTHTILESDREKQTTTEKGGEENILSLGQSFFLVLKRKKVKKGRKHVKPYHDRREWRWEGKKIPGKGGSPFPQHKAWGREAPPVPKGKKIFDPGGKASGGKTLKNQ